MTTNSRDEESIFAMAMQLESRSQRDAFLDEACGTDSRLRERVLALLHSHDEASGLLNPPIAETAILKPISEKTGSTIGPYKLLQKIGEGGFGVVYMAEQHSPVRRKVALKIIKPGMDTNEVIARFEAERQALALMEHPNIAKVFDAGATETGRPYFVMELVKGVPLVQFCDENSLNAKQRLELFVAVCRAVQHAHQKGIIHRDLKPSNVMVTIHDNKPVPKVIDFGVSKAISQQLTERTLFTAYGQMVGTPIYMSPEQAQMSGLDVDTRSDIYSLGVMLFELLTGSTPLDAERLRQSGYAEMQRLIREEEAPKPSQRLSTQSGEALAKLAKNHGTDPRQLGNQLRGDLDWIVIKSLEKDRNRRYETANGFAADVERYLKNESVLACPPSASYRIRKLISRNRGTAIVGSVVAAALVLAIAGLAVGYYQAEQSAVEARVAWGNATRQKSVAEKQREVAEQQAMKAEQQTRRAEEEKKRAERERERAEQERERAELATHEAVDANLSQAQALTDVYTMLGMSAAEHKEKAQAMLWFTNAAKIAPDKERERYNRIRARSWCNDMLVPIAAFEHDAQWVGATEIHPSHRYLMTREMGPNHAGSIFDPGAIAMWEIPTSNRFHIPTAWLPLKAAVWSPDGSRLAVVDHSDRLLEVDFPSYQIRSEVALDQGARMLSYSPSGKLLAIYGVPTARVWDCEAGEFATQELEHPDVVAGLRFNASETRVITTCYDSRARIFDVSQETNTPQFDPLPHVCSGGGSVTSGHFPVAAVFVGDGRFCLASKTIGRLSRDLNIYDAATGERLSKMTGKVHYNGNLIPVGDRHIVVRQRKEICVIDVTTFDERCLDVETIDVRIAVSPKSNQLLTCGTTVLGLFALDSFDEVARSSALNTVSNICGFSADGEMFYTAERGGLVKVWQQIKRNPGVYNTPLPNSSFAAVSPDGLYFAPIGLSQRSSKLEHLRVYEVSTGRTASPRISVGQILLDGQFFPSGESIALGTSQGSSFSRVTNAGFQSGAISVWNWQSGENRFEVSLESEPRSLAVSPDGSQIVALSADGRVTLLDATDGEVIQSWTAHDPSRNNNWYVNNGEIALSPDGRAVVTWGAHDFCRVWDLGSGRPHLRYELKHQGRVLAATFSPDANLLATSQWNSGNLVQVWDFSTGERVGRPMPHPDWAMGIRFSPDGQRIVSACRDRAARLWNWRTGELVCPPMKHGDEVHDATFHPDGTTILTTCYEGSFGIWEPVTGKRIAPPIATQAKGTRIMLTPDGMHAIVCGHRGDTSPISVIQLNEVTVSDPRPIDDVIAMAEFFAGHRIVSANPQRLTNDEVASLFSQVKQSIQWELGQEEYVALSDQDREKFAQYVLTLCDKDENGAISNAEAPRSLASGFSSLDRNADGELSPAELTRFAATFGTFRVDTTVMFSQMDGNSDGFLDAQEWRFSNSLLDFDDDGDGRVSPVEFSSFPERLMFSRLDADHDQRINAQESARLGELVSLMDTDFDSVVTFVEYQNAIREIPLAGLMVRIGSSVPTQNRGIFSWFNVAQPISAKTQRVDPDFAPQLSTPTYSEENSPTLAIDEGHRNGHTIEGSFSPFAKLVEADGCRVLAHRSTISPESLKDLDILVIANALPTNQDAKVESAFDPSEIETLVQWVHAGGALLLLADHRPYGEAAKELGAAFGVEMSGGYLRVEGESNGLIVFERASGRLAPHAITDGHSEEERIGRVVTFTGQAFRVPDEFSPLLTLGKGANLISDISGVEMSRQRSDVSGWHQGAVADIGSGRIALFGEAGMFSAQLSGPDLKVGMNAPGAEQNQQFLLNVIHWLSRNL